MEPYFRPLLMVALFLIVVIEESFIFSLNEF